MKYLSILTAVALCLGMARAAEQEKIRTYSFQEFETDGVPKGWKDDTAWADVDKKFGADRISEEQQVAKVTLEAVRRGKMQLRGPAVPLKGGRVYTLKVRLKASQEMPVEVGIREGKPPFKAWAVRKTLPVRTDWSTQSISFEVGSYLPDYELLVSFGDPGTVWLESIQILEETKKEFAERAQRETQEGNLLPNGDFRLGRYGWSTYAVVDRQNQYPIHTGRQYALEPPAFRVESRDGRPVGLLELTEFRSTLLSDMFAVKMGAPFECTAKVRRTKGGGMVTMKVFSPSWSKAPATSTDVGTEWKEIRLAGAVPFDLQLRMELATSGGAIGGDLEIGQVIFQQRAPADPAKASPVFAVTADRDMTAYVVGEIPRLTLHAAGLGEATQPVKWTLVDADGREVRAGQWTIRGDEASEELKALPVGWYQVRWSAPWADEVKEGSVNIAVVPPVERVSAAESPWGIHVEGDDQGVEKMRLLGARWLRTNNPLWTKWSAVQPEKDRWIFPDEYVEKFTRAGLGIIGNLDRTPSWASPNPTDLRPGTDYFGFLADMPADWKAWEEYVRQMVTRYKDKITYWEVWNEPDITFLRPPAGMTNAEAYLQILEHSTPVIKEANPNAKVIASPAYILKKRSNPEGYQPDFTEKLIEAGGMKYVDIFAIHHYLQLGERVFEHPEKYAAKLAAIRDAMKAADHAPVLWNSEWGVINFTLTTNGVDLPSNNGMTPAQAAQEMVVWSVGQLAEGMEKLFWYDGQDNFYYHFHVTKNFFDYRQPRPLFVAYSVLTKVLDGLAYQGSRKEGEGIRVISFGSGDDQVDVAYVGTGGKGAVALKPGQKAMDYLGRPVPTDGQGMVNLANGPVYLMAESRMDRTLGVTK